MALQYSFIENSESNTERPKSKKHCRTLRKRHKKKPSSKIDNLLNSLSQTQQSNIFSYLTSLKHIAPDNEYRNSSLFLRPTQ